MPVSVITTVSKRSYSDMANAEQSSRQPAGYTYTYPRPAVTVDVVLFTFSDDVLQVLLIKRRFPPFQDAWALPGGFVDMQEDLYSILGVKKKQQDTPSPSEPVPKKPVSGASVPSPQTISGGVSIVKKPLVDADGP